MTVIEIIPVILPVFLTIGVGLLIAQIGAIRADHVDGLMVFAQNVAMPCLLFRAMLDIDLAASFDPALLASFYIAVVACFVLGIAAARLVFAQAWETAVAQGFSAMFCNALLLGVPITEIAFGKGVLPANFAIVAFQAPFCYALGVAALELSRANGGHPLATVGRTLRGLVRQPQVIALATGLALNLMDLSLPPLIRKPLDGVGDAALPVALFALGGVLSRYDIRGSLPATGAVLLISLVINPALTWLLAGPVFHLSPGAIRSAVITAAMAPGVNSYMFASTYGVAKDVAASALILGTAVSIVTASVWISLLS